MKYHVIAKAANAIDNDYIHTRVLHGVPQWGLHGMWDGRQMEKEEAEEFVKAEQDHLKRKLILVGVH